MPPKIYNAKKAKRAKKDKKAYLLQGANAQSATTKAYSTTMGWAKKGGRRWSPPGGYNPPPTVGGNGVLDQVQISQSKYLRISFETQVSIRLLKYSGFPSL